MSGTGGPLRTRLRHAATAVAIAVSAAVLVPQGTASAEAAEQQAVDDAVAAAASAGIEQSVSVVDRTSGNRVASSGGAEQYISESIVKLFTVAYYEHRAGGHLDDAMSAQLRSMIINSDDAIQSSLWNTEIVPDAAARYGLLNTRNGPKTGPHDWGWELITADDEADFLYSMSGDPEVAPLLMPAMADVAATGADGFDQSFGLNALRGDHGSKQGWTDMGTTQQVQIHSVGWTDRYFVAILQTSTTAGYDAMRAAATATAQAVQDSENLPVVGKQPPADTAADADPAAGAETTPGADTAAEADIAADLATAIGGCGREIRSIVGDLLVSAR